MPRVTKEKKNTNKKNNNLKNKNIKQETKEEKFSFDEEIVIGLKKIEEPKKIKENKSKNKKKKVNKKNNTNENNNILIKSKYMSNYDENNENYSNNIKSNYDENNENYSNNIKKKQPKKMIKKNEKKINKKKKKKLKIIKFFILTLIILGGIIYAMLSPAFNIKNINVIGNSKISSDTIISLSGLYFEQNIFNISKTQIENSIKQNAYINNVEIKRKLPDTIEIEVEERIATYMLTLGNAYVYINNQGYILEITTENINEPILIGYKTPEKDIIEGNRLNEEDLKRINDVLKIVEAMSSGEKAINDLITQIDITDRNDYILTLEKEKKKIHLGDVSDLSTKVLWIDKFLEKEKKSEGTLYLNVNLNTERPYFRKKV